MIESNICSLCGKIEASHKMIKYQPTIMIGIIEIEFLCRECFKGAININSNQEVKKE